MLSIKEVLLLPSAREVKVYDLSDYPSKHGSTQIGDRWSQLYSFYRCIDFDCKKEGTFCDVNATAHPECLSNRWSAQPSYIIYAYNFFPLAIPNLTSLFHFAVNMMLCCSGWISDASTVHNFATSAMLSYRENFGVTMSAEALGLATAIAIHSRYLSTFFENYKSMYLLYAIWTI